MRLVAKLTLALVLGMSLVLAMFGYRSVSRERKLFDTYRHRSERLILSALAVSVRETWPHHGPAAAFRLIADEDARTNIVRVRWVWLDLPAGDPSGPIVPVDVRAAHDGLVTVDQDDDHIVVYAPIDVGEGRPGALELTESVEEERAILRGSVASAALSVAALAALGGVMALGLGAYFVGRPVQRIVEKTRRIGEGDLAAPLLPARSDELGWVAREINAMSVRLGEARASLARETTARIAALEQLRHADRLNTVGKLASGIAHELGTPLNVVGGRAKRILRGASPDETREGARIIAEQADRMTAIIRQLLDFARRRGAQKAPTDVTAITRQVFALLGPIADKRRVSMVLDAGEVPARASVDVGQVQQALTNLVMNGIQAMQPGGELTVSLARERATPPPDRDSPAGDYLAVRVRDQGTGILPEHLPHIFEPFFTTKEVGGGTGLGLSVTHGIVEEHGGWIDVTSEPGVGTTFTVYLPAGCTASLGQPRVTPSALGSV